MSAIGDCTVPELTSEQHQTLVTALSAAENHYRNQIKEDPAFGELTATEDADPEAMLDRLIANPALLPDETSQGSDTSEISEFLWEIKHFADLRKLMEELQLIGAGADAVKLEDGSAHAEQIRAITHAGIPV